MIEFEGRGTLCLYDKKYRTPLSRWPTFLRGVIDSHGKHYSTTTLLLVCLLF